MIFKQHVWYQESLELYQENSEKRVSKIKYQNILEFVANFYDCTPELELQNDM